MSFDVTASSQDTSRNRDISPAQYAGLRNAAGVLARPDRRIVRLAGADRLTYLQGLLTNDIAALRAGTGCYAALLTPQGRMVSDMRVFEDGSDVLLDLPESTAATVTGRLEQFIFSEDVRIEDLASTVVVGVYGPLSAGVLASALGGAADSSRSALTADELRALPVFDNRRVDTAAGMLTIVGSDDFGVAGFDLLVPAIEVEPIVAALVSAGAIAIDRATAEITRVEAGRPQWRQDMDEDTIPLEAGIENRAISLTKGCYVGQEIIIRVLHRGHGRVARRLVGLAFDPTADVPAAGDRISSAEREIGRVTSAVFSLARARPLALGYVHRDFAPASTPVLVHHAGVALPATVVDLP